MLLISRLAISASVCAATVGCGTYQLRGDGPKSNGEAPGNSVEEHDRGEVGRIPTGPKMETNNSATSDPTIQDQDGDAAARAHADREQVSSDGVRADADDKPRTGPTEEDGGEPSGPARLADPVALRNEILTMIADLSCTDDAQCRLVGLGFEICGHPTRFVPFSTQTTDVNALAGKVREHKAVERALIPPDAVGTCGFSSPGTPVCVQHALTESRCEVADDQILDDYDVILWWRL